LQVLNDYDQHITILQLTASEACHIIGICLAPDGSDEDKNGPSPGSAKQ